MATPSLRALLSNTISTKKIHLALISNEKHKKGLTWKNVQSFKQNVRCVKFRMMRAVDFGALCIHDN